MGFVCFFTGLVLRLRAQAQSAICGIADFNNNRIKLFDESGNQLSGTEWRLQVFYGYPGQEPTEFKPFPELGYAHPVQAVFFGSSNHYLGEPRHPFIQLQVRVWNTNSALTWTVAEADALCNGTYGVLQSKVIEQDPWADCDCGARPCNNHSLYQFTTEDLSYRFLVKLLTKMLRLRMLNQSDGLHLQICNRNGSDIVLEESLDLVRWTARTDLELLVNDEFFLGTPLLRTFTYYRVRTKPVQYWH